MIENHKIIVEADEALQHSLMMPPPSLIKNDNFSLKQMTREVQHLISRLPSNKNQLQISTVNEQDNNNLEIIEPQSTYKGITIGKYNYIGHAYRFEERERQLDISKPQLNKQIKTEVELDKKSQNGGSIKNQKQSLFAEDSFAQSEIKFPSYSYHIIFDKKGSTDGLRKAANTLTDGFHKTSQTVCLQRKIKKLQKQMKKIKSSNNSMTLRGDGKMKLQKLLDSMIG